jgi:EmrB/QacA subfamily drug resistance transporter
MTAATAPETTLSKRQIYTVFGGLMIGLLLSALDGTIVATALPTIALKLGGLEHVTWVATAYLLCSTAATPLFGKLSDLYGRRRLFQIAIVIFLSGSLLCGLAQSFTQLVLMRGVQGIGGGGLMSMAFVIVADIVPPRERGRYVGFFTSVFAFASIAGPLVGGFFVDNLSWRWIFTINLPIGIAALFVTSWALRLPHVKREHTIDWLGAALLVSGVVTLILTSALGGKEVAWTSPLIIAMAIGGVTIMAVFVWWEKRATEPIVPMQLFAVPTFRYCALALLFISSLLFSTDSFLPLFMQSVTGASATRSGLLLMPLMAGVMISSITSGRLVAIYGRYKIFTIVGIGLALTAVVLFTRLGPHTSRLYISCVQVLMGLGIGSTMPTTTTAIQNAVDPKDVGIATAAAQFMRSFGGAFGLAGYGAMFASRVNGKLPPAIARQIERPAAIKTLPPDTRRQVVSVIAHGVQGVYVVAVPVMLIAWVIMWFVKELPLRDTMVATRAASAASDANDDTMSVVAH